jgi:integrase
MVRRNAYGINGRSTTSTEKWKLVASHTARKTFVVNALRLGIPAEIIMKWTGHSNFQTMKPYIEIVDELKSKNMEKFDL